MYDKSYSQVKSFANCRMVEAIVSPPTLLGKNRSGNELIVSETDEISAAFRQLLRAIKAKTQSLQVLQRIEMSERSKDVLYWGFVAFVVVLLALATWHFPGTQVQGIVG